MTVPDEASETAEEFWLTWQWLRRLPPRERVVRGCGRPHTGVCTEERRIRWSRSGAWIPPEYRTSEP